ncbi:transglutaminase-like domain-containing protein [Blastococcus sp. SYSU D00820]
MGVLALCVPMLVGFTAVFGTPRGLVAGAAGLLLGAAAGWLSALRRFSAVTTAALLVVLGTLAAGPAALPETTVGGALPTLDTLRALAPGVVRCWRDLLTTPVPTGAYGDLLLVPYLTGLLAGVLGVVLALRTARPAWALLPAGAALAMSVLMGTTEPASLLLEGGLFAVLAVVWAAVTSPSRSLPGIPRAVAGLALLAVAATVGTVAGPAATSVGADRLVLRDLVEPPFDVRAYPSPLNGFRKYVKDQREDVLFTVTGLPEDAKVRLATMDAYDGTVWNVAAGTSGDGGSSGTFRRLPVDAGDDAADAVVTVSVQELAGVWLPTTGDLRAVAFSGPRAAELGEGLRYNAATGTAVVPAGLQPGDGYTYRADVVAQPDAATLEQRGAEPLVQPQPVDVPQAVVDVAGDVGAETQGAYDQATQIAETLQETGYFSHGLETEVSSRAGHGAGRLTELLGSPVWIGDQEQYAAAAALMARTLNLPARVVMGFTVPSGGGGAVPVRGDDVTAWIEVAFADAGWVAFDVTPDEDRVPPEQAPQPSPQPKPETQQPPPPVEQPPPPLPATGDDDGDADQDGDDLPGWLAVLLTVAAWVGGPLLLLALPCLVVVALKLRRRRRRRRTGSTDQRVAAGWSEVLDAHVDHGARLPVAGTRREVAGALGRPGTAQLAAQADDAVFSGGTVTEDQAGAFWSLVDAELADLSTRGFRARWRARLSLRSLRRGNRR